MSAGCLPLKKGHYQPQQKKTQVFFDVISKKCFSLCFCPCRAMFWPIVARGVSMDGKNGGLEGDGSGVDAHVDALALEVEVLTARLEDHDTGHIRTAISVLLDRIEELKKNKRLV